MTTERKDMKMNFFELQDAVGRESALAAAENVEAVNHIDADEYDYQPVVATTKKGIKVYVMGRIANSEFVYWLCPVSKIYSMMDAAI